MAFARSGHFWFLNGLLAGGLHGKQPWALQPYSLWHLTRIVEGIRSCQALFVTPVWEVRCTQGESARLGQGLPLGRDRVYNSYAGEQLYNNMAT